MMEEQLTSVVYAMQNVEVRNRETGQFERKFDLSLAEKFGRLEFIIEPERAIDASSRRTAFNTVPVVQTMRSVLRHFTDDDYLLPAGDPSLIAIAAAVAAHFNHGRFKLLKYNRVWNSELRRFEPGDYVPIQIDISGKSL